jgi:hypothetical protein
VIVSDFTRTRLVFFNFRLVSDLRQVKFSPGTSVFSTNKTDRHDITEILLKVALNTIKQTNQKVVSTIPSN